MVGRGAPGCGHGCHSARCAHVQVHVRAAHHPGARQLQFFWQGGVIACGRPIACCCLLFISCSLWLRRLLRFPHVWRLLCRKGFLRLLLATISYRRCRVGLIEGVRSRLKARLLRLLTLPFTALFGLGGPIPGTQSNIGHWIDNSHRPEMPWNALPPKLLVGPPPKRRPAPLLIAAALLFAFARWR